jgi:hypothetical protein
MRFKLMKNLANQQRDNFLEALNNLRIIMKMKSYEDMEELLSLFEF